MRRLKDRVDAGQELVNALKKYKDQKNTIVLALPRGGVPVGYEIASALHLPMTVFIVRKLGVPGQEEFAMGALAEDGFVVMNEPLINQLGMTDREIQTVVEKETTELNRRVQHYRHGAPLPQLKQKNIILVDDGIATGATVKAAILAIRTLKPARIILAVPVASRESLRTLSELVDEVVCLMTPALFNSVGEWYDVFSQTTDEEVMALLDNVKTAF